jgi:hypothetical protein
MTMARPAFEVRFGVQLPPQREAGAESFLLMCGAPFDGMQLRLFAERVIHGGWEDG